MYDSVYFFAKALDRFLEEETLEEKNLDCEDNVAFEDGPSLVNVIKTVSCDFPRQKEFLH